MIPGLVLGALLGLGLLLAGAGLWPAQTPIGSALAPLRATRARPERLGGQDAAWRTELGRETARMFASFGITFPSYRADLSITGRTMEWFCAEKLISVVMVVVAIPAVSALAALVGFPLPWQVPAVITLALAGGAFFAPDMQIRREGKRRRSDFRYVVSAYLDLVAISLAGGSGAEEALRGALSDGHGWAFDRLRSALRDAQLVGEPPWQALGRLGSEIDVKELTELSDSLALAGTEGATVRRSLIEKAASARAHALTDAEVQATSATDQMVVPLAVLLLGFIVFILYPALARAAAL